MGDAPELTRQPRPPPGRLPSLAPPRWRSGRRGWSTPSMTGTASSQAAGYVPFEDGWDDVIDAAGEIRSEWAFMAQALTEIGVPEIARRGQEARRLLEQDGVIDNADGTTGWSLDPVPTLIGSLEWEAIESGVVERAELLNLILEDLYGP